MPWARYRIGHTYHGDLVHTLYEWSKDERLHWDTQCGVRWGSRNNTDETLRPTYVRRCLTCLVCIAAESRF